MKVTTVAIILNRAGDAFLMGYHQRGEGKGKLNFIGGKVADKPEFAFETPEESIRREIGEESGLIPITLLHSADIFYYHAPAFKEQDEVMKVYKIQEYSGTEKENPHEFKLTWVSIDSLPFDQMWESDKLWLPKVLENKEYQNIAFYYDANNRLVDSKYE